MSKKNKHKKAAERSGMTFGEKFRLIATVVVVVSLSLLANGYTLPFVGGTEVAGMSAMSFLPAASAPVGERPIKERIPKPVVGVVGPVRPIPDGRNNFRAISVTPDQLRQLFAGGQVKFLLNLSGDTPGKTTAAEMRAICQAAGVEYVTSGTLDRFDALSGYVAGKGYTRSAAAAARYLQAGGCLVVDRSGNRTGALVGAYLVAHQGFTVEQAIAHNNWEYFATSPGKSYKYLETVTGAAKISAQ